MTTRMQRPTTPTHPAQLPPPGLVGLDPSWSRVLPAGGHEWHLLDTGMRLAELGVDPVGTILCVHGNPTWSFMWRRLLATTADAAAAGLPAWRVIAVDQLEMGYSERTGVSRSLADRVRDLGALTEELGLAGPVYTLGHDWGGVVALGWAVDHPDLLAGAMSLNTAVHQPEDVPIPAPLRLTLGSLQTSTVRTRGFLDTTLSLARPPLSAEVQHGYRAPYLAPARRAGIGAFVADIPVDARHGSHAELDRIASGVAELTVPALLLWGPRDPIFGDRYLDDLVDRIPHADVHRFEGAGHLLAEDADYVSAVTTWLGRAPATADSEPAVHADAAPASDRSLFTHLDALAGSDDTALVEMAPPLGAAPRVVSWRLLARRVRELAAGLAAAGVAPGDRVSLLIRPGADLTAVLYACLRIGAVVVVADAGLGLRGLTRAVRGAWPDYVIGQTAGLAAARALGWPGTRISVQTLPVASRRLLGVSWSLAELIELGRGADVPGPPSPAAAAAILFTSGSTGPAKGVVYTHEQLTALCAALGMNYRLGVGSGLVAGFAPFALLGPALGATSVTPDMDVTSPRTLSARAVAAAIDAAGADVVFLSPAALSNVVASSADLDAAGRASMLRVRLFLSAGAPVSESLLAAAVRIMPDAEPHTPYGMTEGLLMTDITLDGIFRAKEDDAALATPIGGVCVGEPVTGVTVLISALDARGEATGVPSSAAGVTGEIVVSAPHLKDHYDRLWLTDFAATRNVPVMPSGSRWHRTGDVGHLDAGGRLWVEGRMPHVVTAAGGPITPVAVEQRIERAAHVLRAAVVGIGPFGTQQLVAVVETTGAPRVGLASPDLAAAVRRAAGHPIAAVFTVARVPTDIRHNSKIDRTRLSGWAAGVLAGGRMTAP